MQNNLKALRLAAGLKQNELAAKVGISPSQITKWEKGQARLTDVWMRRLGEAIGCHPTAFLEDIVSSDNTGFDKAKFMDTWRRAQAVLRKRAAEFDETTLDAFMEQAADYAHLPEPEFEEKLGTILNAMLALSARRKQTEAPPVTKKKSGN